jgi:hypothetical protein
METTQGNSLCSYLHLKLAKTPHFSYYLLHFFVYKIGEEEDRTVFAQSVGAFGTGGRGEVAEKGVRVQIM